MESRRMCPHCRAFITTRDRVCPYCNEKVGPRQVERSDGGGSILGGFIPHAGFTTVIILLINGGLYLATGLYSLSSGNGSLINIDGHTLAAFGAKVPAWIVYGGQWWRLITAGFLHGGLLHIAMNSWVLFDLGAQVEEIFGQARFIVIYFVATILGFLASTFWSNALSIGASAGIMGLIGAMIALGMMHRSALGNAIKGMYVRWAVYILLMGLLPLGIDNAAHIGGLIGGFVIAWFASTPRQWDDIREKIWHWASWACLALTALSFLKMYLAFASVPQ